MKKKENKMYELQIRTSGSDWTYEGHRSGSISDLKDYATLQNRDYRIVDESGKVVWSFLSASLRRAGLTAREATLRHMATADPLSFADLVK